MNKMDTYKLIDKNSDMVIIISAESEEQAKKEAYQRVMQGFKFFRCERMEE